jgi:hypothetical protein
MFDFDAIKRSAFAALAAVLFSATMIGAAIGPVQMSSAAPAVQTRA